MVNIRSSIFMLMLMFTLLEAREITHKAIDEGTLDIKAAPQIEVVRAAQPIVAKEIVFTPTQVDAEGIRMRLNGRKLAMQSGSKKKNGRAEEEMNGSIHGGSADMSGATPIPRNCDHKGKKGKLNVLGKTNVVGRIRDFLPKKAKLPPGFVAISADYGHPNHHPPRHN